MSSAITFNRDTLTKKSSSQKIIPAFILKFSEKNKRKILKAFLLGYLHRLFCELFKNKLTYSQNNSSMECYAMDTKIIQLIIQEILDTGEYTLEGIAYHTRIPFDVLYDAACGTNNQFSITPWARVIDLYMQVKPETVQVLADKLLEIKEKKCAGLSLLLSEA